MEEKIHVLFVCTGNICRSPTAEVVFQAIVRKRNLEHRFAIHSCGTQAFHVGEGADERATEHAKRRGYDLSRHKARKLARSDLERYDWILCMDQSHLEFVRGMEYPGQHAQVELFLSSLGGRIQDVPDPYYGGDRGFEDVLDLCEKGGEALLDTILGSELDESCRRG